METCLLIIGFISVIILPILFLFDQRQNHENLDIIENALRKEGYEEFEIKRKYWLHDQFGELYYVEYLSKERELLETKCAVSTMGELHWSPKLGENEQEIIITDDALIKWEEKFIEK